MTWLNVAGTTFATALMIWAEWRGLGDKQKRERVSLIAAAGVAWFMAMLILLFPNIPGPIEMLNSLFNPLTAGLK
ncbi:hypothetical protein ACE3NQ_04075 [Paenibacillus terreus]|uniref:Uncharacterized protein n=1 Tax=Paenibacillus terreus TaxID=1387834 RepID=A0ABV5B340_9BACL